MNPTDDPKSKEKIVLPRRRFFARAIGTAGAAALGLSGLGASTAWAQTTPPRQGSPVFEPIDDIPNTLPTPEDGLPTAETNIIWPGKLKGEHMQLVDATAIANYTSLQFASHFMNVSKNSNSVIVYHLMAFMFAVNHDIWARYRLGEVTRVWDTETGRPALRNPFWQPKPGGLRDKAFSIDSLLSRGVIMGCCALALRGYSRAYASRVGITPEAATQEWKNGVIPGITILPSGSWGVNRAQEAGCTYATHP
jgi:hypothetical protein